MHTIVAFNGLLWEPVHPQAHFDMLGYIPTFLSLSDDRPAAIQIAENYRFGGWHPFPGFKLLPDGSLKYPNDPPTRVLYKTKLRSEEIFFYEHAWLRIAQPDGSWEVSRLD